MKTNKGLFIAVFVLLSFTAFSQNWTPIAVDDEYHYELVGSTAMYDSVSFNGKTLRYNSPVNASVWIDSTQTNAGQTVYHLNKIVKPCDTCPAGSPLYLRNQQQFLQQRIIADNAGKYIFDGDEKWTVFSQASIGANWLFDTLNTITAEVIAIEENQIFGNTDSLKTILLSNNDTLVLSKEHGLIRFPQLQNNTYHNLTGIQTRELGLSIPGFQEIYDFDINDVLQYYYYFEGVQGGYTGRAKIYIQGKQVSADSVRYDIRRILNHSIIQYGTTYPPVVTDVQFSYTFYKGDVADKYPGQLFEDDMMCQWDERWGYEQSSCTRFGFGLDNRYFTTEYGQNEDNEWVKFMSTTVFTNNNNISEFIGDDANPDLLSPNSCFNSYIYQRIWEEGLGETSFTFSCFEGYGIRELSGYIIDGDTTGIITPDSVLILSNEDVALRTADDIAIYPNPATDYISFKINAIQAIPELDLTVYDTMGKALKTERYAAATSGNIQVSDLPPGMYLLSFKMEGQVFTRKFVKAE